MLAIARFRGNRRALKSAVIGLRNIICLLPFRRSRSGQSLPLHDSPSTPYSPVHPQFELALLSTDAAEPSGFLILLSLH